ncbi:MAG: coproporphyrinogen dehydrogenase HemZ [Clostridia bacterium]|nr:coproporphyrinogen dehydrogenase HemZ [Clostridia bacterium]
MRLHLEGNINTYYVQTLCMIFFPGSKFSKEAQEEEGAPALSLRLEEDTDACTAYAEMSADGKKELAVQRFAFTKDMTKERTRKLAAGGAVMKAGERLLGYRPSWGMMTGVRPSKHAMELLLKGKSAEETRQTLAKEFFAIPKKAALATEVALRERKMLENHTAKDCSLYVSIPFCPTRCAYCSFVSYTSQRLLSLIPEYLNALVEDVSQILEQIRTLGLHLKTIYIGGGTPTILEPDQLRLLLSTIAAHCDVASLEEYTLESGRPDTITAEKFKVAKEYGVERVSVNPQTLCDEVLHRIGRSHTTEQFLRAYHIARESGISCINTDLIAGLPGDTFGTFARSFDKIMELRPENVTVHTFCVKKAADILRQNEEVYSRQGGDAGKCVDYTQIRTAMAGYVPYYMYRQKNTVGNFENVGFSLPGYEGRYNVYMMEEFHSVFAAGAGAVTKAVEYTPDGSRAPQIARFFDHKYPFEYLRDRENQMKAKLDFIADYYQKRGLLD